MTSSQQPVDPSTVAEVAPGQGPEPGSVEYGGSEIHSDDVGASTSGGGGGGGATTEAGTFEDLPVDEDDQGE
jgi:hypothetical protein